ncbi:MFS transporter [Paracoccus kondratievae]|uniref:MFS transporter n=1 Tax=Paracoccus kondratievae TaxID=135740 RepID=A0AAD3P2I9_9RHOB|nr:MULTISPECIES: MFS transporter [Paracoccus]QFQ87935.1 MFS transporter [Paracoccus kondratievae]GLK66234.1 MFS transporter [Paracoccus kondratievae]SMG31239.1 Sugar phosphate permease [Paracoccus sp. J56]
MRALMSAGIISLILAYTLSQFYRAFLAVLAPVLRTELGADPEDLAISSGMWFLTFALMQIPIGTALDRVGPRRTVAALLALGGAGGAAVFALAQAPWHLHVALALMGVGCAPALMGSYYIFARTYPAAVFGTLAGATVGFGSMGNILGTAPLLWAIEAIGWRETLALLALATLAVAVAILALTRDPERLPPTERPGSLAEILRLRPLWFILPLFSVNYAASAAIRGLWAGPYMAEVHDASDQLIGQATLAMGVAMVVGNFLVGPALRLVGSIRRLALISNGGGVAVMAALWLFPAESVPLSVTLLALVGLSGVSYSVLMAHGRAFLPQHLVGRGVTFLNMFSIGGTGLLQFSSRPVYRWASAGGDAAHAYSTLFLFFLIPLTVGFLLYFLTPETPDA